MVLLGRTDQYEEEQLGNLCPPQIFLCSVFHQPQAAWPAVEDASATEPGGAQQVPIPGIESPYLFVFIQEVN